LLQGTKKVNDKKQGWRKQQQQCKEQQQSEGKKNKDKEQEKMTIQGKASALTTKQC